MKHRNILAALLCLALLVCLAGPHGGRRQGNRELRILRENGRYNETIFAVEAAENKVEK